MRRVTDADIRVGVVRMVKAREALYQWFANCLSDIYLGDLYKKWGFKSFEDYLDAELELPLRIGQSLVTYGSWYRSQPKNVQEKLKKLGFSKARRLMGRINKDNALEVIDHAANTSIKMLDNVEAEVMDMCRDKKTIEIVEELSKKAPEYLSEYLSIESLLNWIYNERELIVSYIKSRMDE